MHAINVSFFSTLCTPYYDNQYVFGTMSSPMIKDAILHPNSHNLANNSSANLELWNKNNTVTTLNNNTVYKTIYSPSPSNYLEPISGAFTNTMTPNGSFNVSGSFNSGWNFYSQPNFQGSTIYFAALGYKSCNSGAITNSGTNGIYWTSAPYSSTAARNLNFQANYVRSQGEDLYTYSFSLRSVIE